MDAGPLQTTLGQVLATTDASEAELIARIRAGDTSAFGALFDEYFATLCGFVFSYVHDGAVAEELVQDLFCTLWHRRVDWHPPGRIKSYLLLAARNRAISHLRHRKIVEREAQRAVAADDVASQLPLPSSATPPDHDAELAELADACRRAIHALPERRRLVVTLRWQHQLSHAEIAHVMGISVKGVEVHLTRALKTLRSQLQHFKD